MTERQSLACNVQESIGRQWKLQNFSDVTVVVEDTSFQCHKLILGACSGFFQNLFRTPMKEKHEGRVELGGLTKETFSVILDLIYTGIDGLTEQNVRDIWSGSDQLIIDCLITHCEEFVKKNLNVDNCFVFYSHAVLLSSGAVEDFFFDYVRPRFESIRDCPWFCELSVDEVGRIIGSDDLAAKSEDSVVEAVLKWLEYIPQPTGSQETTEVEGRSGHTVRLLSAVRLCLVSPACLRILSQHKCVLSCDKAHEMVIEAMYYVLCLENRHDPWPVAAVHRLTSQLKHAAVFVKGSKVRIYGLDTGTFHEHSTSPYPKFAALTVFDNVMYMCEQGSGVSMYTREGSWETVLPTTEQRRYRIKTLLLTHAEHVYCLDTNERIFKGYNCTHGHKKEWQLFTNKLPYIQVTSQVRFHQYILLFSTEDNKITTHCFDTTNLTLEHVCPENSMEGPDTGIVSFSASTDVYILQRNGQLWKVVSADSSLVDFCKISQLCTGDCKTHGAVIYRQTLVVFVDSNSAQLIQRNPDCLATVSGLCEEIKIVNINSDTQCSPILVNNELFTEISEDSYMI